MNPTIMSEGKFPAEKGSPVIHQPFGVSVRCLVRQILGHYSVQEQTYNLCEVLKLVNRTNVALSPK